MVQQIYNNYSPQYNYNYRQLPPQYVAPIIPYYEQRPDFYQPQAPQYPWDVAQQFVQRLPQAFNTYRPTPETTAAIQNIYNQADYSQAYYSTPSVPGIYSQQVNAPQQVDCCPWVQDPELKLALGKLAEISHDPADVEQIRMAGANPPYNSGKEALEFILQNQIKVEFTDMGDSLAHAQWINEENKIGINQKYRGKMTLPMALAIADAIYHEAGHAKDRDGVASIQEELDCLSLNTLGFRYQQRAYPEIMNAQDQSRLLSDGVALYPKLFFDNDPQKAALVKRVSDKYGYLPLTSPNHTHAYRPLATVIKQDFMANHKV